MGDRDDERRGRFCAEIDDVRKSPRQHEAMPIVIEMTGFRIDFYCSEPFIHGLQEVIRQVDAFLSVFVSCPFDFPPGRGMKVNQSHWTWLTSDEATR